MNTKRGFRMRNLQTIVLTLTLLAASSASGFDGNRKGFVLGGGLGFAPVSSWSVDISPFFGPISSINETGAGIGLNLIIGHAWDEQNMIVYEGNVTGWKSDFFDMTMSQGFNGGAWYHYFGIPGRSAFTTLGLGVYLFDGEDVTANDVGIGFLAGGGYEFARHWQVGGYFSLGRTSDAGVDFDHYHLNILVSGVAF